jgi:hypothetical protein
MVTMHESSGTSDWQPTSAAVKDDPLTVYAGCGSTPRSLGQTARRAGSGL